MTLAEKETTLKELEAGLWETADSLRNESSLTSQMYYMPVLGIIFLRHATYRFRMVEKALLDDPEWPKYKGVPRPVEPDDFETKSAMFAPQVASDDGVFFTPKSIVRLIVNFLEPTKGSVIDPACGSGGMFVSSGDFVADQGGNANLALKFYGQEKTDTNGKICLMNMAMHGFDAEHIRYGEGANTFFHDASAVRGKCDYVMANPPFNCHGLKADSATAGAAGRLPWGLPSVNKEGVVSNGNYLWIQYFYSYLKSTGKAGFVEAAKAKGWRVEKKELLAKAAHAEARAKARDEIAAEREWLVSKFGKTGKYKDVPGLCKSATRAEIAEKKFSLNPGAYVGVPPQEDDGVDFTSRMKEIHAELLTRQKELGAIMKSIDENLRGLGL